jgi:hypothetical protein
MFSSAITDGWCFNARSREEARGYGMRYEMPDDRCYMVIIAEIACDAASSSSAHEKGVAHQEHGSRLRGCYTACAWDVMVRPNPQDRSLWRDFHGSDSEVLTPNMDRRRFIETLL